MKFLFHFGIILSAIFFLYSYSFLENSSPDCEIKADKITEQVAKKLEEEKKLYLVGTGGGMMSEIRAMHMSFHFFQELDLDRARKLILYIINEYLLAINCDKEIRPYLHDYPFTPKNIEIRIWIYNPDRSKRPPDKIYYVSAIDGSVEYYIRGSDPYQPTHRETYEEAQMMGEIRKRTKYDRTKKPAL